MKKILVTGGSGFIGTHLVNGLIEQGCTVANIDIKPPLLADHIPMWRKVHILNIDDLKSVVQKEAPEAVIHLARISQTHLRRVSSGADEPGCGGVWMALRRFRLGLIV